jgi:hypothetical protein
MQQPVLVVLGGLNAVAAVLWLVTRRPMRFVLALGARRSLALPADMSISAAANAPVDPVERRLADDIRRWRATWAPAGGARTDSRELDPWIAEVEATERHAGGSFLPGSWRDSAAGVARGSRKLRPSPSERWHEV